MSGSLVYDRRTIVLHWLTAALVVGLWGVAQIIDFFPTALHVYPRSVHILFGVVLVVVYLVRLSWRFGAGRRLPPAEQGVMGKAATGVHHLLYLLLAATLVLGLYNEAIRADSIFNLFRLPSVAPDDAALRRLINGWHGTAANALLIVAGLHAFAALFHHYVLKDGVLRRMLG